MKDIYDLLQEEDLTPDLQMLSAVCGLEAMRKILRNFGGIGFYFPKVSRFEKLILRYVQENVDKSCTQIAKELKVSAHYIRTLRNRNQVTS